MNYVSIEIHYWEFDNQKYGYMTIVWYQTYIAELSGLVNNHALLTLIPCLAVSKSAAFN